MKKRKFKAGHIILMAAVSKAYGIGDTVYVYFNNSTTLEVLPQQRIVAEVRDIDASNTAQVTFTSGEKIMDGGVGIQTVFTTQALCAAAIINAVITKYAACVALDTTQSRASTASLTAVNLGRCNS